MRLDGKTALITGGASGIGRATVMEFARCGARVICADIDAKRGAELEKEAAAQKLPIEYAGIDMADSASVRACAAESLKRHNRVDILVNAAGWNDFQLFLDNKPDFIDRVIAVNLGGALHLTQALLPAMIAAGGGKIVSVASDAGRATSSTSTASARARPTRRCCNRGRTRSRKPSFAPSRSAGSASRRRLPTRSCSSRARAPTTSPARC